MAFRRRACRPMTRPRHFRDRPCFLSLDIKKARVLFVNEGLFFLPLHRRAREELIGFGCEKGLPIDSFIRLVGTCWYDNRARRRMWKK